MGCAAKEEVELPGSTHDLSTTQDSNPIMIFTDCGAEIDDQWMLVHLMGMEDVEINAVFSSHHGGHSSYNEADESREIIDDIKRITGNDHIRSFTGSNQRLKSVEDINHSTADDIYELLQEFSNDNKVIVVISGPATDLASALNKFPSIAQKMEICATAFYSRDRGTSYNVHNDPIAWQILLKHDIPITVSPNHFSMNSFLISIEEIHDLTDSESEIAQYLSEDYMKWITENEEIVTQITGDRMKWPIWDLILPAHLSGYSKTEDTVRPILQDNGYFNYSGANGNSRLRWITDCDSNQTWEDFKTIIGSPIHVVE